MDQLYNLLNEKNDLLRPCLIPVLVNAIRMNEAWTFHHLEQLIRDLASHRISDRDAVERYRRETVGSASAQLFLAEYEASRRRQGN